MTVVGIHLRAELELVDDVRRRLDAMDGVRTIELEEEGCLGVVLEADGLRRAHDRLRGEIERIPGVLTAWPIQFHHDSETPPHTDNGTTASR